MKYYNNKTVFITGGTSGIGLEMGKQLANFGANVVVFGRKNLETSVKVIEQNKMSNKVYSHFLDTTDIESIKSAFHFAEKVVGTPDIVIHSAGIGKCLPFLETSQSDFEKIINSNVFGSRNVADVAFNYLKKSKGQLLFIASLAGLISNYGYSAYCSSKFATVGFASVLRSEWKPYQIRISVACPPEIDTPLVEAERLESPKVAKVLKQFAGNLKLTSACSYLLKELSKNKFMIIPGFKAKFVALTQRILPSINFFISDLIIKKMK
ncbi:SDR family NAD(P)-dependent oxidoreductase [Flammeovirga kamogawensis]|uniref:SDR family NAD(P)-dependent oxidoreductase n=1 Tax=Flammeovirga kamogawensis TaxID=373891 RepID=A0ABX8H153_9BACT|nr:SDR family NAD(P)-dependent oxidoreductase [Flammeovirga kamogawensis]MBB6462640.1 NAD(P)-dependent dehydrogenase (short-subunit alcohol dehydrogenase family) [Flammeovirga kamogawensis]QWG09616.1 SDR family NAD(P)-dependent oxidoreductase [Flammeovirga kamogawensis]TRX65130.1 SDR family NAD(P)-dependent oxidoreductase [Flammeovirga kamogawensis]